MKGVLERIAPFGVVAARSCPALIFIANGLGIVDQARAASELAAQGLPAALVIGFRQRLAALALAACFVPATPIAHDFWELLGGLLFVAFAPGAARRP